MSSSTTSPICKASELVVEEFNLRRLHGVLLKKETPIRCHLPAPPLNRRSPVFIRVVPWFKRSLPADSKIEPKTETAAAQPPGWHRRPAQYGQPDFRDSHRKQTFWGPRPADFRRILGIRIAQSHLVVMRTTKPLPASKLAFRGRVGAILRPFNCDFSVNVPVAKLTSKVRPIPIPSCN